MKTNSNLTKLYLLVITLPKGKKEVISDLLENFGVIGYLSTLARGTYSREMTKELMFCVVREDKVKDAIFAIEDKFAKFNSNMSMVYAVPLDSVIGLSSYMTLANGGKR